MKKAERGVVELFENVINTFLENEDLSELYFSMGNMEVRYRRKTPSGIVIGFSEAGESEDEEAEA